LADSKRLVVAATTSDTDNGSVNRVVKTRLGNTMPAGIPVYLLQHLQSMLNAAAMNILCLPRSSLASLHWHCVAKRK